MKANYNNESLTPRASLFPAHVAEILNISTDTVRRLVAEGVLVRSRNNRKLTITRASLSRLLSEGSNCGVDLTHELRAHGTCLVFTVHELAAELQIHPETVRRKIRSGELPSCPHLGVIRIPRRASKRWMKS